MSWRKLFQNIHLWLGLASGVIVVILCLTGTLLGVREPIEAWVNRDVLQVQAQGERLPLEQLVPKVVERTGKTYTALTVPPAPTDAVPFFQGRQITYVNPYTGEVLGGFNPTVSEAFMVVFRLHRWLLLETPVGRPITGAVTVIFLFILLTGLMIWWPKRMNQLKRLLTIRTKANWKGLNYDFHVVLGFYSLIPLLVMGASGLYWSYNPEFKQVVYAVLDGKSAPVAPAAEGPGRGGEGGGEGRGEKPKPVIDLPYTQLIAETNAAYPYSGPIRITFPSRTGKPVEVAKTHLPTSISLPYTDRIALDPMTAAVVKREPFAEKSRAEKLLSLIKQIHIGTIYGGLSLTIYVITCAIGTTLPITGFVHWLSKQQARRRRPQPTPKTETREAVSV